MATKFMSMRNLRFLLYEVFDLTSLTRHDYYREYDRKMLDMVLQAAAELAERLLWPCFQEMDRNPPKLADDTVKVHPVVITIDDGWRTTYDIAFPILKRYGYPATLFVYTQLISGGAKSLSWDQVREMAAQGLDVQCHTVTHRNLAQPQEGESAEQYLAALRREIEDATSIIEQKTGLRPTILAYPYGDTNGLAIELLRRQGYRAALTVQREANPFFSPPFRLGRSMIYGDYDLARFEKNLKISDGRALR